LVGITLVIIINNNKKKQASKEEARAAAPGALKLGRKISQSCVSDLFLAKPKELVNSS
jgi:hypothetical protein